MTFLLDHGHVVREVDGSNSDRGPIVGGVFQVTGKVFPPNMSYIVNSTFIYN